MLKRRTLMMWLALCAASVAARPAQADYVKYGQGMQAVASGTVANAALDIQTASTWINATTPAKPYTVSTDFAIPACDDVVLSRLLLTVWGGNASYTCGAEVTVNGEVAAALASMGGDGLNGSTPDANPSFTAYSAGVPNVYGGGFGVWLLSVPVSPASLHRDGSANSVSVTISDPAGKFDGRLVHATFLCVYQQASLDNFLDYVIAEGTGDIYRNTAGAESSRTVDLGTAGTADAASAALHALYTYGDFAQNDRLYFNGVQLGSDDVASHQNGFAALDYVPDLVSFDVTSVLQASNSVRFSVDAADGIGGTLESSLRPSLAVLEITHVPEPATAAILAFGAAAVLRRRRG